MQGGEVIGTYSEPPEAKRKRGRPRKISPEQEGSPGSGVSSTLTDERIETPHVTQSASEPSAYPDLPKELDRRRRIEDAEVIEEPLQMFTAPELQAYLDDLESRYAQAPDRQSIEEIRADAEEAKGKMFPFDAAKVDVLYGNALEK